MERLREKRGERDWNEWYRLKRDLNEAYKMEEIYWSQKARNQWLHEGDKNTKIFHASTIQRRRRNTIGNLQKNGTECDTEEEVEKEISEFYRKLFETSCPRVDLTCLNGIPKSVTREMNRKLTQPVEDKEIKEAFFNLNPHKAPGPDGQAVNFNKSSIFFSKNSPQVLKDRIQEILCGLKEEKNCKYLGLPFRIGKSKKETFKYTIEATVHRISNWKNVFLSNAGKEVMIKAVLDALPVYVMSCFLLPIRICKDIGKKIAGIWWDDNDTGSEKLH